MVASSGVNNWQHMAHYGYGIAILVVAAEIAKLALPVAMLIHARRGDAAQWCVALLMWCIIVVFSFFNTFGNALTRHAMEKGRLESVAASVTRPEHLILKEISLLPACKPLVQWLANQKKETPDQACLDRNAAKKAALDSELKQTKARQESNIDVVIDKYTVEDGYMMLASRFGISLQRHEISVYLTLLWTLLAEVGSAFGGLAIPERRKDK
jgi:hypothetical protein